MATMKAMTLRLPEEQFEMLEMVAQVEEKPVSDVVRQAINDMIVRARADNEFQSRREALMARHQELLNQLAAL
jgi:predicted transcriptional regulator